jgi:hypothetical protein
LYKEGVVVLNCWSKSKWDMTEGYLDVEMRSLCGRNKAKFGIRRKQNSAVSDNAGRLGRVELDEANQRERDHQHEMGDGRWENLENPRKENEQRQRFG